MKHQEISPKNWMELEICARPVAIQTRAVDGKTVDEPTLLRTELHDEEELRAGYPCSRARARGDAARLTRPSSRYQLLRESHRKGGKMR